MHLRALIAIIAAAAIALPASAQGIGLDLGAGGSVSGSGASLDVRGSTSASLVDGERAATGTQVRAAAQVATDAELSVYRENLKVEDERVADARAEEDGSVVVEYFHDGRLLGIIPVKVRSTTELTAGERGVEARTSMPWWNFLVTGTGSVAAEVDDALDASVSAQAAAGAAAKAQLIEAAADAHARVAASASLSAK